MKKTLILLLAGIFSLPFYSCGPGAGNGNGTGNGELEEKEKKGPELVVMLEGEAMEFAEVNVNYDDMFEETISINAVETLEGEEVGGMTIMEVSFTLSFEGRENGEWRYQSLSMDGYSTEWLNAEISNLQMGSGTWGPVVESLEGTFEAEVRRLENHRPTGDPLKVTGSFRK